MRGPGGGAEAALHLTRMRIRELEVGGNQTREAKLLCLWKEP